ncbi:MAG: CDP-alcohol phosphatidyltransferase family protein [Candidatus Obscuribacterales bacterium]|nr:CDP-alcohol phosphatidyltransferase family protein [Candidatus Obscuribacterales bacterium]
MNLPNFITIARVILAIGTVSLLWQPGDNFLTVAAVLTAIVIWADGLDGFFARKLKQCTKLGAVLDIAGDRAVELLYWICFAVLNWIPVWVPILYLMRGTFVDAIRAQAFEKGYTAFGEKTMMESALGRFLVASDFSRFTYAVTKAAAFCLVIAAQISTLKNTPVPAVALFCVYASAVFCVLRGLPVLIEGRRLLSTES